MERICQFCSRIDRLIPFPFITYEVHLLQSADDLVGSVFIVKFFLQVTVYDQRDKTGDKVSQNSLLTLNVNRTSFEIRFDDPKAFFYLPAAFVYFCNRIGIILKVGAYGIETIILFFLFDSFFINVTYRFIGDFSVSSCMIGSNEPFGVILFFLLPVP